jgi:DnaA family protein
MRGGQRGSRANESPRRVEAVQQLPLGVRLADTARFDSYVAGTNRRVVELMSGTMPPRMLWLWGRRGTGKTHLLQAACAAVGARGGSAAYLDLEAADSPARLEGFDELELVCLDGLETAATDPDWNAAIFRLHTLMQDSPPHRPGRLQVASTAPPASLRFQLPDLRSRLLAASIHQLSELTEEDRVVVLEERARRRGLDLPRESAAWLVHHLPRDLHTLCGALDRLDQAALVAQRRLTVPFLRQVLQVQSVEVP